MAACCPAAAAACRFGEHQLLCEVHLSFRSVLTLKSFAHPAYEVARLDMAPENDKAMGLVEALFTVPKNEAGTSLAYGYAKRKPEEIKVAIEI